MVNPLRAHAAKMLSAARCLLLGDVHVGSHERDDAADRL
jgi:hypothetical protein